MAFVLTPEQEAIVAEGRGSKDSLLINALAGAAKTSTLCLLAAKLPVEVTLCCAFNKRIAEAMKMRMPSHIQCATLNSLGHRVWGRHLGKGLTLETDKGYNILSAWTDKLRPEQKKEFGEGFASVLRAVRTAKAMGFVPDKFQSLGAGLIDFDTLLEGLGAQLDVNLEGLFLEAFLHCMEVSIAQSFNGTIDFDDQIYMSTLFGGQYPSFPIIMVDEAQDLSTLNHKTLELMFGGRLIAVGDPHQSIYAFRGADKFSMPALKEKFQMKELTLSISFRCPIEVVKWNQRIVPHFQWMEGAKPGLAEALDEWSEADIPDGAAIICRNNAPLFSCALKLIRKGRGVKLIGSDIGAGLIKTMTKFGPGEMDKNQVWAAMNTWLAESEAKAHESRKAAIVDKYECMMVFTEFGETLDEMIAYAKRLFASEGPIQLMTGHKSKGLEFDQVFHLDPWRIPSKFAREAAEAGDPSKLEQETNLKYVINTRAKEELRFINLDHFK